MLGLVQAGESTALEIAVIGGDKCGGGIGRAASAAR